MRARPWWSSGRAALVFVAFVVALGGCSALLPPAPSDDVRCEAVEGAGDPCVELGQVCVEGFCRNREICNGVDDDTDGRVDEGPASDADGDGFTSCGGGVAALADCNDDDASIHPADPARGIAAPDEICDGRDNQCDGMAVDAIEASGCVGTQRCSRSEARCVEPTCSYPEFQCAEGFQCVGGACLPGDCTRTGCLEMQVCDPVTRACVTPLPLGASCATDAQCEDQRCLPMREALAIAGPGAPQRACARTCCSDVDCPGDFVCWAPGTGARACVARTLLETDFGPPESTERACSDGIACEPGACEYATYEAYDRARTGFICGDSFAASDAAACTQNNQCRSGICQFGHAAFFGAGAPIGPCTGACRTASDCNGFEQAWNDSFQRAGTGDEPGTMGCLPAQLTGTADFVQVCFETDGAEEGTPCNGNAECLEGACFGGICRGTCCNDADCGSGDLCRPFNRGQFWSLHCAPPLTTF